MEQQPSPAFSKEISVGEKLVNFERLPNDATALLELLAVTNPIIANIKSKLGVGRLDDKGHPKLNVKTVSDISNEWPFLTEAPFVPLEELMGLLDGQRDVFLAHDFDVTNEDNYNRVVSINRALVDAGFSTFFDTTPGHGSSNFIDTQQKIASSRLILVFISKRYLEIVGEGRGSFAAIDCNKISDHDTNAAKRCYFEFLRSLDKIEVVLPVVLDPDLRECQSWTGDVGSRFGKCVFMDMSSANPDLAHFCSMVAEVLRRPVRDMVAALDLNAFELTDFQLDPRPGSTQHDISSNSYISNENGKFYRYSSEVSIHMDDLLLAVDDNNSHIKRTTTTTSTSSSQSNTAGHRPHSALLDHLIKKGASKDVVLEGQLSKRARPRGFRAALQYLVSSPWSDRRFVLAGRSQLLKYFDGDLFKGEILLTNTLIRLLTKYEADGDGRDFAFALYDKTNLDLLMVMAASSLSERDNWVASIHSVALSQHNSDAIVLTVDDGRRGIRTRAVLPSSSGIRSTSSSKQMNDPLAALRSVKRAADIFFEGFCFVKKLECSQDSLLAKLFSSKNWEKRKVVADGMTKTLKFFNGSSLKEEQGLEGFIAQKLSPDAVEAGGNPFAFGLYSRTDLSIVYAIATSSENERKQWILNLNKVGHDQNVYVGSDVSDASSEMAGVKKNQINDSKEWRDTLERNDLYDDDDGEENSDDNDDDDSNDSFIGGNNSMVIRGSGLVAIQHKINRVPSSASSSASSYHSRPNLVGVKQNNGTIEL